MSENDVREIVGEPDSVTDANGQNNEDPFDGPDPASVLEWHYEWNTPFTMWIIPTILLFTIVLTYPAFFIMVGIGGTRHGHLHVDFGADGRVRRKWVDPVGFF
jgi:hypothetical protein